MSVSVMGLGFVGGSILKSLKLKGCKNVIGYDKYKDEYKNNFEKCLNSKYCFIAVPTQFDEETNEYDKSCIRDVCEKLEKEKYSGLIILKCTVEPQTTENLIKEFPNLKLLHNPEFLTAATAFEDFHNQKHIVLGRTNKVTDEDLIDLITFYKKYYPDAEISTCTSTESESMKIFVNCFYSVKVQFFNELYLLCKKMDCSYNTVRNLMLKNKWINPMHTDVPGPDGKLSYGGYCFPKDTNALLNHMIKNDSLNEVLKATIKERNIMRDDDINIKKKK
jgi:UDPglucose 6-dehydrogenase